VLLTHAQTWVCNVKEAMLNRRILRAKAMKSLYALEQAIRADYHLAHSYIDTCFEPDLNSMEVQDTAALAEKAKLAKQYFTQGYRQSDYLPPKEVEQEVREVVRDAIAFYRKRTQEDRSHYRNRMLKEAEDIRATYLLLMRLLVRLGEYAISDLHERKLQQQLLSRPVLPQQRKLGENPFVKVLAEHNELNSLVDKLGANPPSELVGKVFRILRKDSTYTTYADQPEASIQEEQDILIYILRDVIFKNELILDFFEERDLNWKENRAVVRNMALKTIKGMVPSQPFEVYALSRNWDEDRDFFLELFNEYLSNGRTLEKDIMGKLQNWDINRVALIDRVILTLALTEMIEFPSIPLKVSINEYVEMAKIYGTPKSKEFVNGLLDKLSSVLVADGRIRKSGRGLIDNQ